MIKQKYEYQVQWTKSNYLIISKIDLQSCAKELEWSLFQDSGRTIHSAEKNDTSYKWAGFFTDMKQKKIKMADLENSKWLPQKNLIFQLRQFSIFFHEIFMDWSLG